MVVEQNERTGGLCAVLQLYGEYYFADLSRVYGIGGEVNEFMVVPSDSEGNVRSWSPVFVRWTDTVTEDEFLRCLEAFQAAECSA